MKLTHEIFFAALLPALASAQSRPQVDTAPVREGIGIATTADGITAVGRDYKALFTTAGARFVPALGPKAPRSQALSLHVESVRRDGANTIAADSAPILAGEQVRYERGAGIVERFDVRPHGLEHSFEFAEPPAGTGDLAVRLRLATELTCAPHDRSGDGLEITGPWGGIRIGGVTGVDAAGARAPGWLRYDGSFVDYVLPAAFVDAAAYPLVLDPLIGSAFTINGVGGTESDRDVDVASDSSTDQYFVVWERSYSGTDVDILGRLLDSAGNPIGLTKLIEASTPVSLNPAVASIENDDGFVVIWQEASSIFGPWSIRARAAHVSGLVGATTTVHTSNGDVGNPDIGGTLATGPMPEALAVFESINGLISRTIGVASWTGPSAGALTVGPLRLMTNNGAHANPAVSQTSGAAERFLVVHDDGFGGIDLVATRDSGIVLDTETALGNGQHGAVDGDGTDFLVTFERFEPGSTWVDVRCRAFRIDSNDEIAFSSASIVVDGQPNDHQRHPAVAFLGEEFLLAWTDQYGPFIHDVYCRTYSRLAQPTGLRRFVSFGTLMNWTPAIASRYRGGTPSQYVGNSDLDRALIAWTGGSDQPPFQSEVRARLFEAIGSGGAVTNIGTGCGPGGVIGTNGPFAIGNTAFEITVSFAPSTAFLFGLRLSLGGAPVQTCGSCSLADGVAVFVVPSFPGTAAYPWPLPSDPSFVGLVIDAQWFHFGLTPNLCPLFPQLSTSDRLRMTIGS